MAPLAPPPRIRVLAGSNSTELGCVGIADTLAQARRHARRVVTTWLPNGEGSYTLKQGEMTLERGERSIRTQFNWFVSKE